jgi:hypothetical protein
LPVTAFDLEKPFEAAVERRQQFVITRIDHRKPEPCRIPDRDDPGLTRKGILSPGSRLPSPVTVESALKPNHAAVADPRATDAEFSGAIYASIEAYKVDAVPTSTPTRVGQVPPEPTRARPRALPGKAPHHPAHKGTEVLLIHIDGDPDRPIIIAGAPNPQTPLPAHQLERDAVANIKRPASA